MKKSPFSTNISLYFRNSTRQIQAVLAARLVYVHVRDLSNGAIFNDFE